MDSKSNFIKEISIVSHCNKKDGYDDLSKAEKKVVRDAANKDKNRKKAKGGYLTIRGGK